MAPQESDFNPRLEQLTSKRFPTPIKFPFTAYSHCHDLLAIVTSTWDVSVFRITNGQLAFSIRQKAKDVEVSALSWKGDGTCLGVGWSDGHYAIYDGGTGKQMQVVSLQPEDGDDHNWLLDLRIKEAPSQTAPGKQQPQAVAEPEPEPEPEPELSKPDPPRVGCFGWMGHQIEKSVGRKVAAELTTDDWYDGLDEDEETEASSKQKLDAALTDLPRAITTLDVTKAMPRLSTIQTHSTTSTKLFGSMNKFGSQQATNNLFHTRSDTASNIVQSLVVCQEDGAVQVLLDETVKVGSTQIPGRPIMHVAHPQSSSHAILSDTGDSSLTLSFMDLPLQVLGGSLLHIITTNTKRMQILLEYILQTVRCIEHDFRTGMDFQQILTDNFDVFLEGELESDQALNLFHLAMTGGFTTPVKEWHASTLSRKQKDWEQAMNAMYTHLQNHVFVNLLPALDQFSIAVTYLRGLADFYEGSSKFDCPAELFTKILEHIDSLRLVAHKMQLIIQTEHRQFRAFHKWIKMNVEVAMAGPLSAGAIEVEEREVPNLDYALILPYIKEVFMRSKLTPHAATRPEMVESCSKADFFQNPIIKHMSYKRSEEAMRRLNTLKSDEELTMKDVHDPIALLNLPALTAGLMGHVRVALRQITDQQSRMLSEPKSLSLPLEPGTSILDMKMEVSQDLSLGDRASLLARHPTSPNRLHILEIFRSSPVSSPSSSKRPISSPPPNPISTTIIQDTPVGDILDAKWIPHTEYSFLVLVKSSEDDQFQIVKYANPSRPSDKPAVKVLHVLHEKTSFKPTNLIVGGRKGKLICVILGSKGREWRVFDLDRGVLPPEDDEEEDDWVPARDRDNVFDPEGDEEMVGRSSGW